MKTIKADAAVICDSFSNIHKIFATVRGYGAFQGQWEFHLSMDCFWCEVISGQLTLNEAKEASWLTRDMLDSVPWLPADLTLMDKIRSAMNAV